MQMNEEQVKLRLKEAITNLLKNQPNLFQFTPQTRQTEWNLAHHLANEIHKMFPDLDCDLDVIKPNLENKRPDIILHTRGTHASNFLVIEVKRDEREVESDLDKIKRFWFAPDLNYQFGAVIVFTEEGWGLNNKKMTAKTVSGLPSIKLAWLLLLGNSLPSYMTLTALKYPIERQLLS